MSFEKICRRGKWFLIALIVLLCLGINFTFAKIAQAQDSTQEEQSSGTQENFKISLNSSYQVNATGKTLVKQQFKIVNLTPEFFLTKYGIIVSSTNLENIQITDNGQVLEPQINKLAGQTSIGVTFEEKVVGEGKSHELIISYLDQDVAEISGKVLEVNIPALADPYQYQDYQLSLLVPNIFGNASRINPTNFTLQQSGDFDSYHYNNLNGQAVSAIFGDNQIYDLKLSYKLDNPNSQNALTQITLPPETPWQKVHYEQLDPLPKNIKVDPDGNFIATYEVPANNSFQVELLAKILLTLNPNPLVPAAAVLPEQLAPQKFWETDDPGLLSAAAALTSPADINRFVIEQLDYTEANLNQEFHRLGAAASLKGNNLDLATCQEYTDLFIALARIKQIPAKRLVGYAYSSNEELKPINVVGDVLHAWPAFYNSETELWQNIDPTWQDTTGGIDYFSKFDLNHIVFAINGVSSTLPYPAGSYLSTEDKQDKKIYVEFSQSDFPIINPDLIIDLQAQTLSNVAIPSKYLLSVENQTGQAWYFAKFQLTAPELLIELPDLPSFIAPFQRLEIPLSVYNKDGLIGKKSDLAVNIQLIEGQNFNYESSVSGLGKISLPQPATLIVLGGGLILFALTAGSLLILGRTLAGALRRQGKKSEEASQQLHTLSTALSENQTASKKSQNPPVSSARKRAPGSTDRS